MGIIINLSNNVTHYASINKNFISITKDIIYQGLSLSEEVDTTQIDEIPEDSNLHTFVYNVGGYNVTGGLSVWTNETDYRQRNHGSAKIVSVAVTSPTVPINPYETIYQGYKDTLDSRKDVDSYTDDI
jgi:hypothetical protein